MLCLLLQSESGGWIPTIILILIGLFRQGSCLAGHDMTSAQHASVRVADEGTYCLYQLRVQVFT
jgi:hypothetical protein